MLKRHRRYAAAPLVALFAVSTAGCTSDPKRITLLGDATPGLEIVLELDDGDPTVWVSSPDNNDPRSGGDADLSLCSIVDGGGKLVKPEGDAKTNGYMRPTTLFPVATIKDYKPPTTLTCSGSAINHFYAGYR